MACGGCSRLRLGGVVLDDIWALHPFDWSGLWGFPGRRGRNPSIVGRSGTFRVTSKMAEEREAILGIEIGRRGPDGLITTNECQHLEANQDTFLGLIGSSSLKTLEFDQDDGSTRYLEVEVTNSVQIQQELLYKRLTVVMVAPYPQWRASGSPNVADITGTMNLNPGGNAEVEDAVLSFTADGKLTNNLTGDGIAIAAPSYASPVLVNLGSGEVSQGGVLHNEFVTDVDTARIFYLVPGVDNSLTASAGTIGVTYRSQWW